MKRHSGKQKVLLQSCFNEKKIKYFQELLIAVYRKKRAKIESLVIYRKNNSKKHNNISIEEILSLCF